jgi:transcriptional regulator with XRE-family HTH domain
MLLFQSMATARRAPAPEPEVVLSKAVLRAAARLDLRQRALSAVLGASEASISRLQRGRPIATHSKEGELALLFLRMYRSLDTLMGGNDELARRWLTSDNVHLGGVPADRITSVQGLVDVVQYLDAVRGRV